MLHPTRPNLARRPVYDLRAGNDVMAAAVAATPGCDFRLCQILVPEELTYLLTCCYQPDSVQIRRMKIASDSMCSRNNDELSAWSCASKYQRRSLQRLHYLNAKSCPGPNPNYLTLTGWPKSHYQIIKKIVLNRIEACQ